MRERAREGFDRRFDGGGRFFEVGQLLDEAEDCGDVWGMSVTLDALLWGNGPSRVAWRIVAGVAAIANI